MTVTLEMQDFDKLVDALDRAPQTAIPLLTQAMDRSVKLVTGRLKIYPEATEANQPGRWRRVPLKGGYYSLRPMGFYERHRGWWYPIMRKATLGVKPLKSAGAMTARRARGQYGLAGTGAIAGYKLAGGGLSEFLGQSWTTDVRPIERGVEGVIGTGVSYAQAVQGDRQARFHAERGWKTAGQVLTETTPDIEAEFDAAIDEILRQL